MSPQLSMELEGQRPCHRQTPQALDSAKSCYHLLQGIPTGGACEGLACWIARNTLRGGCAPEPSHESIHPIRCLGACHQSPASHPTPIRPPLYSHTQRSIVLERLLQGGATHLASFLRLDGYNAFLKSLELPRETILEAVESSGLRGRGGAGFPTGLKWRLAHRQSSPTKHIIANADEGDSGAFIDRALLEWDPHAIIEGMLIAARAIQATHGWIYLRAEYPAAHLAMTAALAEARSAGWIGPKSPLHPQGFEIQIVSGHGSYICGEESALIQSMEGRRPEPTARPPYCTEKGLHGFPTVVNNIETLVNIPWIIRQGAAAFHALGFSKSQGTKVLSMHSLFQKPGLHEVEWGTPLQTIVHDYAGGLRHGSTLKGLLVGGPLAGIVPPHLLPTRLGFEEMRAIGASVGHGGIIPIDSFTPLRALLARIAAFAASESCGKCTPCRLGSRALHQNALATPQTTDSNRQAQWISLLHDASLCGLGTGLAECAASLWRHYPNDLLPCNPA